MKRNYWHPRHIVGWLGLLASPCLMLVNWHFMFGVWFFTGIIWFLAWHLPELFEV